jgi:transposase-like protein
LALRHGINANQLRRWIKVERGPERAQQASGSTPHSLAVPIRE